MGRVEIGGARSYNMQCTTCVETMRIHHSSWKKRGIPKTLCSIMKGAGVRTVGSSRLIYDYDVRARYERLCFVVVNNKRQAVGSVKGSNCFGNVAICI